MPPYSYMPTGMHPGMQPGMGGYGLPPAGMRAGFPDFGAFLSPQQAPQQAPGSAASAAGAAALAAAGPPAGSGATGGTGQPPPAL